ncbi:MAG: hypothetical protein ETSY2_40545 [Candidatus Entotheonella gemina]|uniref:Sigma-54 factor interaction domain-containing protein n=1 Tax=Candidatus Entotheonella gemina TaxID=1429439 RepID=W4LPE9_9BACT|nr:MAG: hypothetical protein ETSY2_40545 [Candidatus Entotheonella gemina]
MKDANRRSSSRKTSEISKVLTEEINKALFIIETQSLRVLESNTRAAVLLGYTISELIDLRVDGVFSFDSEVFWQVLWDQQTPLNARAMLLTKSGRHVAVDMTAYVVEHQGQSVFLMVVHDQEQRCEDERDRMANEARLCQKGREGVIETTFDFPSIVGYSHHIQHVCRLIGLVAKTDTTVLVQGETGTGKELVAQAVHFHSRRARGPLVKVNCAALSDTLLESELFGHKKGAFTGAIQDRKGRFQLADSGTLILDEISSMSLAGQAKLLRVLQEKELEKVGDSRTVHIDVRVVAVSNADLAKAVETGSFREDLYYRLNTFPICLPPLRERKMDISLLARHFLRRYALALNKPIDDINSDAMSLLMDYLWPGNVRELENTIEYAVILEEGQTLSASSLPNKLSSRDEQTSSLRARLEFAERQIILEALSQSNWVKKRTAQMLGIDHRNLSYFLNKHDLQDCVMQHAKRKIVHAKVVGSN